MRKALERGTRSPADKQHTRSGGCVQLMKRTSLCIVASIGFHTLSSLGAALPEPVAADRRPDSKI